LKTAEKKLYEGMFLVDANDAASDWEGVLSEIRNILERSSAEVVSLQKWDDRKLAYEIDKKDRGCYILCYFNVEGPSIAEINRDIKLNERIMRAMILSAEPIPQEIIEADTPVMRQQKALEQAQQRQAEEQENAGVAEASDEESAEQENEDSSDDEVKDASDEAPEGEGEEQL